MIVVICVDDKNGIGFNRRRQSRDRLLIADLVEYSQGRKILISRTALIDWLDQQLSAKSVSDEMFRDKLEGAVLPDAGAAQQPAR